MDVIQWFKSLAATLYGRAQRALKPSQFVVYSIGFSLFLTPVNAFCTHSMDDWNRISGPIPIVNQAPIQLLFLQPAPDRAEPYPEGRYSLSLTTAITNTLQWGKSDNYYGYMDLEMIRTSMELKYGIFSGVDIAMSVPFAHGYGGFMDHSILEFEKWFNASRNLREKEERYGRANTYTYVVKKNGKAVIEGKEGSSGFGDLALRVKGKIWDEGDRMPCLSTRFSVKIPTGDENKAFGSGEMDYGIGLLLQKTVQRVTS